MQYILPEILIKSTAVIVRHIYQYADFHMKTDRFININITRLQKWQPVEHVNMTTFTFYISYSVADCLTTPKLLLFLMPFFFQEIQSHKTTQYL